MNPLQDLDSSTEGHFEKQIFNPFDFQKVLIDESNDPDINLFSDKYEAMDSPYFSIDEFVSSSQKLHKNSFSVLHINIRSLNKNFEKLREYLSLVKRELDVVTLTETWNGDQAAQNSSLQLPNYTFTEEEVWQYMSITLLILKYQKNKALIAMIYYVHVSKLLEKTPRIYLFYVSIELLEVIHINF